MINKSLAILLITALILCLESCATPRINSVPINSKSLQIIQSSIAYHQGSNKSSVISNLTFVKEFSLFDQKGNLEFSRKEQHQHDSGAKKFSIQWSQDNQGHTNNLDENGFVKTLNGRIDKTADPKKLKSAMDAARFTVNLPYNLIDASAKTSFEGEEVLEDGTKVLVVKMSYDPDLQKHHTTHDTWWHYFNAETYRHEGYMVKHLDHQSYVRNHSFTKVNNRTFAKERTSWRVDQDRNILWKRAVYFYTIITCD